MANKHAFSAGVLMLILLWPSAGSFSVIPFTASRWGPPTWPPVIERLEQQRKSRTTLAMRKGMQKQAELRKKMEIAKRQNMDKSDTSASSNSPASSGEAQRLTANELKERNDRLRFEELLRKESSNVLNDYSSDGYLNKKQEEETIDAMRKGVDLLFEGDPAPTQCFEELVSIITEKALGKANVERIIPWLRKNQERRQEFLIIISDPRLKSPDLRQSMKNLVNDLPAELMSRTIFVNADSPAENRRWIKKNDLEGKLEVYSDEKMEWMQAYTALGERRWSMTMFIIADGLIQRVVRDMDMYAAARVVQNAVKSLNEARL